MTVQRLKCFLKAHLVSLRVDSASSEFMSFPQFDLTAFDYLDFAERSLSGTDDSDRINCVAHLKRAAECQLDTFLHVMNLTPKRDGRSFPRKLESIQPFGFLSMRSVAKINRARNQLEHDYTVPHDIDVELYFELVSAFVYALEGFVLLLHNYSDVDWWNRETGSRMRVKYICSEPSVQFLLRESSEAIEENLVFTPENLDEWNEAARLFFLLARASDMVSADFVFARLDSRERQPAAVGREDS